MDIRRSFFSFSKNTILPIYLNLNKKKTYSTCFHRVSNENSPGYPPLKVDDFEQLINYFSRNFDLVDLADSIPEKGYKKMVVTFDDGYKDFQKNALPILIHYNCPVTQNVIIDSLDTGKSHWTQQLTKVIEYCNLDDYREFCQKRFGIEVPLNLNQEQFALEVFHQLKNHELNSINEFIQAILSHFSLTDDIFIPMLNWNDLKEITENSNLVKWGCHTKTHKNLGQITDSETLEVELLMAKLKMENKLGVKIDRFAFPNGDASQEAYDFASQHFDWIQFTEFIPKQVIPSLQNHIERNQPYYQSVAENLHKSFGIHNIIQR
jgi:peptidoglycan/xylan/chitin deacetylase (PgdA/CDA1 family)